MKYQIIRTHRFQKDYKIAFKRGKNLDKLKAVILQLANGEQLSEQLRDHGLTGEWKGFRECHIEPDWLLIYYVDNDTLVLTLSRTGSHSDLF